MEEKNPNFFQFTQFEYSSDDESDSSSPSSHDIFVNFQNDPDLAYYLDGDCIIREETLQPTQEETQDEDDGFYQPQPEDEYMGEQMESPPIPMLDQPSPLGMLFEDTSHHYANELEFDEPDDVKNWAREHAKRVNCVLVCNGKETKTRLEMVCERSGDPDASHKRKGYVYKGKTNRKNTVSSKKIKCPFKLVFSWNKSRKKWFLAMDKVVGRHNHERPDDLEGHAMAARLTPREKEKIAEYRKLCVPPQTMLRLIKQDNPDNKSSLYTIYNAIETIKRNQWKNRNVMQQLFFLAQEKGYAVQKKVDSKEEITHLFIAHPKSVQLAQSFHEVLIMDCTYKTNKYEMPLLNIVGRTSTKSPFTVAFCFLEDEQEPSFTWALQQMKAIYRDDEIPGVIVTDNDVALMNAIKKVFPLAHNMLCTFHIWCNVMNRCKPQLCPPKRKGLEEISKLPFEKQKEARKKFDIEYTLNHAKWVAFSGEWEALTWSLTEEEYYLNLAQFKQHWSSPEYPDDIITYVVTQWLEPHKERFVYAFTNNYKHFGNQATSLVESAHHRLKKNLFGCVDNFVVMFNAMESYFNRDIERIKEKFQKSRLFKYKRIVDKGGNITNMADLRLFKGLHYNVSRACIKRLMVEVNLIDIWGTKPDEVCVCNMMKSMGLPCRHIIAKYEQGIIPLSDIDPHWQHLSFAPPHKGDVGEEFGDNEMGRAVIEMYRNMNKLEKQIFWDDMRPILFPHTSENVQEPSQSKVGRGRPKTKETKKQVREYAKVLLKKKSEMTPFTRDPCGHEYTAAKYQEDSKKRGRKIIEKGESSERDMKKKGPVLRSQPTPSEPSQVNLKAPIHVTPPIDDKRYLEALPSYIRDYVIAINDVPPDGNCGFHVVKEQLGPFTQGVKLYGDEITYIRQMLKRKLKENPDFYKRMLSDGDCSLNMQLLRFEIRLHGGNPITRDHWMSMPICGHLIADAFNCVVHYFSKSASFTFTPKSKICVEQLKHRRVVIAFVDNNHFVGLRLQDDCPLPPICGYSYWEGFNPDTMLGWCIKYEHNMEMWKAFMESDKIIHGPAISLVDD